MFVPNWIGTFFDLGMSYLRKKATWLNNCVDSFIEHSLLYDWKNSNNPRAILEQLENAEITFEQRVQTLAKKSRLYTGQTPVGLFTLSSPKAGSGNGHNSYSNRYVYFDHAQGLSNKNHNKTCRLESSNDVLLTLTVHSLTSHLRDFYTRLNLMISKIFLFCFQYVTCSTKCAFLFRISWTAYSTGTQQERF